MTNKIIYDDGKIVSAHSSTTKEIENELNSTELNNVLNPNNSKLFCRIPEILWMKWLLEEGFDARTAPFKEIKKRVDRDYSALKAKNRTYNTYMEQ